MTTSTRRTFVAVAIVATALTTNRSGHAANRILDVVAPGELGRYNFYTDAIVSYEADVAGELAVTLEDAVEGGEAYARGTVNVTPGRHTERVFLLLEDTLAPGATYAFRAKILDTSGRERATESRPLVCRAEDVPSGHHVYYIDALPEFDPFAPQRQPEVYLAHGGPVTGVLSLKSPSRGWQTYAFTTFRSDPGYAHWVYADLKSFPMTEYPVEGSGYVWETKLFDASGAMVAYRAQPVDVAYRSITRGRLLGYGAAGEHITPGGTESVRFDYVSRGENDVRVDLLDPQGWTWLAGAQLTVPDGQGTRTVSLPVPAAAAQNERLAVMIKMLPKGGTWQARFEEEGFLRYRANTFGAPKYWAFPLDGSFVHHASQPSPHAPSVRVRVARSAPDAVAVRGPILSADAIFEPGRRKGYELDLATGTLHVYERDYPANAPYTVTAIAHDPRGDNTAYKDAVNAMRGYAAAVRRDMVQFRDERHYDNAIGVMEAEMVEAYLTRIWSSL